MPNKFEGLNFIDPEINITPLDSGDFTDVANLELPEDIKEQFKSGWIVKEYKKPYKNDLSEDKDPYQIVELLKLRQQFLQNYFKDLKDFVTSSQFVIGGMLDDPTIYEFQKKIDAVLSVDDIVKSETLPSPEDTERFNTGWAKLTESARATLKSQLSDLSMLAETMPRRGMIESDKFYKFKYHVVDLVGKNNVLIDSNGKLHLIDTNFLVNLQNSSHAFGGETPYESYQIQVSLLKKAQDIISK